MIDDEQGATHEQLQCTKPQDGCVGAERGGEDKDGCKRAEDRAGGIGRVQPSDRRGGIGGRMRDKPDGQRERITHRERGGQQYEGPLAVKAVAQWPAAQGYGRAGGEADRSEANAKGAERVAVRLASRSVDG